MNRTANDRREALWNWDYRHVVSPDRKPIFAIIFSAIVLCSILVGQTIAIPDTVVMAPTTRFDLSQVGYQELSEMARRSGASNLSLDFLDSDHILFTFNPKKLFIRHPDCPLAHDDRLVHAVVLELSSGKVLKQTDWYFHDAHRYLWTLGSGKILLRKLNSLYLVDSDLQEKLLWTSSKDLLWVSVSPDGRQIITETADDRHAVSSKLSSLQDHEFKLNFGMRLRCLFNA